jgi:hypothetical protein
MAMAADLTVCAAVLLVAAYGIGAPFVLLRTLLFLARRRRLRYRSSHDEVLATSRFTIPVSLIVPIQQDAIGAASRVHGLLQLRYPELEVIVVTGGNGAALDDLRKAFGLHPAAVFYRRSLEAASVRAIYRGTIDPRVLVIDAEPSSLGATLNCGVNLARYRYIASVDVAARFHADALLEAMHAALEDPARVVGATTMLTVTPLEGAESALRGEAPTGLAGAVRYLAAARARLHTLGRRRLDLPAGGCPGFTLWRHDALLDVGGFSAETPAVHADMTFRLHQHFRGDHQVYRIIHVAEAVGTISAREADVRARRTRVPARLLWRHRGLFFNPALGRLGLFDLPRYAFNLVVAPWVEMIALGLVVLAVAAGSLSAGRLLVVLFIVGIGNGVLTASALLLLADPARGTRPAALFNLLLVGPFEYFATRPAQLFDRLRRIA